MADALVAEVNDRRAGGGYRTVQIQNSEGRCRDDDERATEEQNFGQPMQDSSHSWSRASSLATLFDERQETLFFLSNLTKRSAGMK